MYNVSSATLTSYVSHGGDNMDTSLPSYVPRPSKEDEKRAKKESKAKRPALSKEAAVLQTVRNVLVVLALSLHAVFEGMAVGLQQTNQVQIQWQERLFTAVAVVVVAAT